MLQFRKISIRCQTLTFLLEVIRAEIWVENIKDNIACQTSREPSVCGSCTILTWKYAYHQGVMPLCDPILMQRWNFRYKTFQYQNVMNNFFFGMVTCTSMTKIIFAKVTVVLVHFQLHTVLCIHLWLNFWPRTQKIYSINSWSKCCGSIE